MSSNGTGPAGLVEVRVGACRCPGTPHTDGDIVYLYPELSMAGGIAAQVALAFGETAIEKTSGVAQALVDHAVADWTFVDAKGAKVAINAATIRGALPWKRGGREVVEKATELFSDVVAVPLVPKSRKGKTPTRTGSS